MPARDAEAVRGRLDKGEGWAVQGMNAKPDHRPGKAISSS